MSLKECLGRADELALAEGLLFERRAIHALFATADQQGRDGGLRRETRSRPSRIDSALRLGDFMQT